MSGRPALTSRHNDTPGNSVKGLTPVTGLLVESERVRKTHLTSCGELMERSRCDTFSSPCATQSQGLAGLRRSPKSVRALGEHFAVGLSHFLFVAPTVSSCVRLVPRACGESCGVSKLVRFSILTYMYKLCMIFRVFVNKSSIFRDSRAPIGENESSCIMKSEKSK